MNEVVFIAVAVSLCVVACFCAYLSGKNAEKAENRRRERDFVDRAGEARRSLSDSDRIRRLRDAYRRELL